jgi:hypothetical protein
MVQSDHKDRQELMALMEQSDHKDRQELMALTVQ